MTLAHCTLPPSSCPSTVHKQSFSARNKTISTAALSPFKILIWLCQHRVRFYNSLRYLTPRFVIVSCRRIYMLTSNASTLSTPSCFLPPSSSKRCLLTYSLHLNDFDSDFDLGRSDSGEKLFYICCLQYIAHSLVFYRVPYGIAVAVSLKTAFWCDPHSRMVT